MLPRLIRDYLRPYAGAVVALCVLQVVGVAASLYLPSLNADIIDSGVAQGDTGYILTTGAWMLVVSAVQVVATIVAVYFGARSASAVGRDLRAAIFGRVGEFSTQDVTRFGTPTLISRGTNDVTQVQQVITMGLTIMISAPVMMIGGVVMAIREEPGLAWLMAVSVPALAVAISLIISRMIPQFRLMQKMVDAVNRILREQITGVRVVRAFVREDFERGRFAEANAAYTDTALRVGRLMALAFPIVMLIFNTSTTAVLWFGAQRIDAGQMQIGSLTAFMAYLMQVLMSVMMATFMSMMIPRAAVSAGRIGEVLDTEPSVHPPSDPQPISAGPCAVEFREVTFCYPGADQPVLDRVSFLARPGTTTAIIGATGSGKTTLMNLVPRLFDVTGGAVLVGGVDVRAVDMEDLWSRLGLIPQRAFLFSGSVASNLRYGKTDANEDELWEALRIAQADDFVAAMAGGLAAEISQGGTTVSGGQRQRLAIARAVLRRPQVYLFDDSFSALDLSTDARLRAALAPLTAEATVLVVAQRVSTITDADQIVVLDDGRVIDIGTHEELLTRCGTYQEIVESQQSVGARA